MTVALLEDGKPQSRSYEVAHRIASRFEGEVGNAFVRAIDRLRTSIDLRDLEAALVSGNLSVIEAVAGSGRLAPLLIGGETLLESLELTTGLVGETSAALVTEAVGLEASFNRRDPNAILFAREQAAELVAQVSAHQKEAVRIVVAAGQVFGLPPVEQARAIREFVGLRPTHALAPLRFADELRNGHEAAATRRRLSAVDKQRIRSAIRRGAVTEAFVDEMRERYTASLLNRRAIDIGRTETLAAANHGQRESWRQALQQGVLPDTVRRVVIVTPDDRLRETHAQVPGMNPGGRGLQEAFDTPWGQLLGPPWEPLCWAPGHNVFTCDGWRPLEDVAAGDRVWTLDASSLRMLPDVVDRAWSQPFDGRLVHVRNRTLDMLVTPEHAFTVVPCWDFRAHGDRALRRRSAADLKDGDHFPLAVASWSGPEPERLDTFGPSLPAGPLLQWLGWFLSEGSVSKPPKGGWQMKVTHHDPLLRSRVRRVAGQLFETTWEAEHATYVPLRDERMLVFFRGLGKAHEKRVPADVLRLGTGHLRVLFEALVDGDGTRRTPERAVAEQVCYSTSSVGLADDLTEIILKLGLRPTFSTIPPRETRHRNGVYRSNRTQHYVHARTTKWSYFKRDWRTMVPYSGPVHGFSMRNRPVVLVRRERGPMWIGNCRCGEGLIFPGQPGVL